jgi:hypothetical protein
MSFFDRFERIYLWLDNDELGKTSAQRFAKILGPKRTLIIDTQVASLDTELIDPENVPKDANDALRLGIDFRQLIKKGACWTDQDKILSLNDLASSLQHRIMNTDKLKGVES